MAKQLARVAVVLSMFAAVMAQAHQDQALPDPQFTAAMQKGEAALKARRFEEAIDAFKQANAFQNKSSAAAFHGLGRAYHGLGAFKTGAESCAEGLKHVGGDRRLQAMLHNQRGMALFSLADKSTDKEIRDAEAEFRSALVLAEAPPIAWYNLGIVLLKQSRDQEGIVALQAYIDSGARAPEIDLARRMIENPRRGRETYAPDYAFASSKGDYISSKDLVGKTVLLDFWGTWCGPCRQATPDLVRLYKKYRDQPFEMLGISSDKSADQEKWVDYIAKTKMEWPQYLDLNRQVIRTFQVNAFPTYIVVDTEGIVRTRRAGYGLGAIDELESAIKKSIKDGTPKTFRPLATPWDLFVPLVLPGASLPAPPPGPMRSPRSRG
jgi:thiol-disulfide isomerase/thioredoxin